MPLIPINQDNDYIMTIKITQKIVGFSVNQTDNSTPQATAGHDPVQAALPIGLDEMHEALERPEMLIGSTYKVKTPLTEHAMYITINDMLLNAGTPHEQRMPFEVFINSKSMDHFQWIVALTRIISAVFRKGGDVTFLASELKSVFDPKGGYFKQGGKYMPSLVAEIGDVIEQHMRIIGLIKSELGDTQKQLIAAKRQELEGKYINPNDAKTSDFPKGAALCPKCLVNAVVMMDGCMTCLNCGDSKCG